MKSLDADLPQRDHGRIFAIAVLALLLLLPSFASGQSISELQDRADRFRADAESLYRLDADDLNVIWDAYCGGFDPKISEDREFAADIGKQLQNKEGDLLKRLLSDDLPRLVEMAGKLRQDADTKDKADNILEGLKKEEGKLRALNDGAVLKGSNHPFVQFALEYGQKMHKEMCAQYGEEPKACDQRFPGIDGRPDLVTVENGRLVVYEFKPDTSKAKDKGWTQVKGYLAAVVKYYQDCFEDGRDGEIARVPDGDHGGREILEKLKKSKDAWSSDGKYLQVIPEVRTYRVCDKQFN